MDYFLFEGFMDGIVVLSKQGVVKFLNTSAATILRLHSLKMLMGKVLTEEIEEFGLFPISNPDDHLTFSEVQINRSNQPTLVLMVGLRTIPGSEDGLLYLRDLTVEVNLKTKFDDERSGRQLAIQSAHTDALTGSLNKAGLFTTLELKWQRLVTHGGLFSIIVLDLDGFKQINDLHGHSAGDQFLAGITRQIEGCLRERDRLGRFGGDEFVALLNDCAQPEALIVAKRILNRLRRFSMDFEGNQLRVTASIGLTEFTASGATTWEEFFQMADNSSLQAKRAGKNTICIHPDPTPIQG